MRLHHLADVPRKARPAISELQRRLELPLEFPDEVLAQAEELRRNPPSTDGYTDRTDIEFVTIDPPSSTDLDQALHIEREDDGYLVHYAIADVGHFVEPGSPLDVEAHRRGQTLYAPGARIPLHPPALSEDAGSLLADGRPRPAVLWSHHLDADGNVRHAEVERAMVLNRHKLHYAGVQADLDAGRAHPSVALLPTVGELRARIEVERGGISLNLPQQEIVDAGRHWELSFRGLVPVEDHNAQISLLTGFVAARMQIDGGYGVLRTLPPAEPSSVDRLRRAAATIGVPWEEGESYPEFVRRLDPNDPRELAVLTKCTILFRGAGYLTFFGQVPDGNLKHNALGAEYAHTTAPLRRLVDRYVLEICLSLANGTAVPDWVLRGMPELPEQMRSSGRRASAYENGVLDIAEALVLHGREGELMEGVLVDVNPRTRRGTVQIPDSAVELHVQANPRSVGETIRVRVDRVDVTTGDVELTRVN
ncbi:MAG: RNB domain-containing ribonuclease [Propionibacterium sp.]|nr:RNB domain-containing ribonuclease [Propionibacterium sp.]